MIYKESNGWYLSGLGVTMKAEWQNKEIASHMNTLLVSCDR